MSLYLVSFSLTCLDALILAIRVPWQVQPIQDIVPTKEEIEDFLRARPQATHALFIGRVEKDTPAANMRYDEEEFVRLPPITRSVRDTLCTQHQGKTPRSTLDVRKIARIRINQALDDELGRTDSSMVNYHNLS